jgi:hypothetical protein
VATFSSCWREDYFVSFNFGWASNRLLSLIVAAASVCCALSMQGCAPSNKEGQSGSAASGGSPGNGSAGAGGNHLKGEVSPYLLEHSRDPVNWYPWGDEAFARAKRENKPIFLSSGFARLPLVSRHAARVFSGSRNCQNFE